MNSTETLQQPKIFFTFAILKSKPRDTAIKYKSNPRNLEDYLEILYKSPVYDPHIIHRKIERLNITTQLKSRINESTNYTATDKLINHLIRHQINLLGHFTNENPLLT